MLIILDIFKGEETPYYYAADGDLEAYVRVGNESVKATPTEQKRLVLRGKNTSYDLQKSTFKVECVIWILVLESEDDEMKDLLKILKRRGLIQRYNFNFHRDKQLREP